MKHAFGLFEKKSSLLLDEAITSQRHDKDVQYHKGHVIEKNCIFQSTPKVSLTLIIEPVLVVRFPKSAKDDPEYHLSVECQKVFNWSHEGIANSIIHRFTTRFSCCLHVVVDFILVVTGHLVKNVYQ